jgi:hypothetical protein
MRRNRRRSPLGSGIAPERRVGHVRSLLGQIAGRPPDTWIPGFGRARGVFKKEGSMSEAEIVERFEAGELTWADLLEITGLPAHVLFSILFGN